jgi:hypothetical protein
MNNAVKIMASLALGLGTMAVVGCDDDGPAERAGEKVDRAADRAGDKVKDAGDRIEDAARDAKHDLKN